MITTKNIQKKSYKIIVDVYGDVDTFSFTKNTPVETTTPLETTKQEEESLSQEYTDPTSVAPKHIIKIDIRYFITGVNWKNNNRIFA